jgi:glycosyltransferase involved in cell wall biosynthesis
MRLAYLVNARIPTEKAHGVHIAKMCEALSGHDVEVSLLYPRRKQLDADLSETDVFEYYGVSRSFESVAVKNWDVFKIQRALPASLFSLVFVVHAIAWSFYAVLFARRQKYDLYYTRDSFVAAWLLLRGLPTILEAHETPRRLRKLLVRFSARRRSLVGLVVLTRQLRDDFVELGFPEDKVHVMPDCVDLRDFAALPSRQTCRKRLGLPDDRPIIGYIGRFRTMDREKGVPELVRALEHLSEIDGHEPLLLCVGGPAGAVPDYLRVAEEAGVSADRIRFVDQIPRREVPYWISACDVVCIPWPWTRFSAYYTSPLKLFEYLAAGVPIVATDLPSLREIVTHGETAWLVEPGVPKSLAAGIDRVLRDPGLASRLSENATRHVRQYTWDRRVAQILQMAETARHN